MKASILRINPSGCGDQNPDEGAPGIMSLLQNLVPDPANTAVWVPRPAATVFTGTQGFFVPTQVGFISCLFVSGRYAYGMAANPATGNDNPFAYDLVGGNFITISGVTSANVPVSPLTSGDWIPPTMDQIGVVICITHPGFNGTNGYFGRINISNPLAPTWTSANLTLNALPAPPTFVKQFNQRAFYVVPASGGTSTSTYASDPLGPGNAAHPLILTYGDNRPIKALGTLGLSNISGGITQALLIFQDNNIFQLTGDWNADGTVGTIVLNSLNISVGTSAPLSVVSTPKGVAFLSQDGFRVIDWEGKVTDPVGIAGKGIVVPFTNALYPSRVVAACNGQTVRVTTQNNAVPGQPFQEWIYDLERNIWHGPHTFPANQIARYGTSYVVSPIGLTGLWKSDVFPSVSSQYTENGARLNWQWGTFLVPNQDSINEQGVVRSTVYCAGDSQFTMSAVNELGNSMSSVPVSPPVPRASSWGTMTWGQDQWGQSATNMSNVVVPWDKPLIFDRVRFLLNGASSAVTKIGQMRIELEDLGYLAVASDGMLVPIPVPPIPPPSPTDSLNLSLNLTVDTVPLAA
jgi:hypothetical protein